MTDLLALLGALALLLGNGFFVGAEFALLAARQTKLTGLAETSRRARSAMRAAQQLPLMISGCQFGITLCSLGLGAVGEPAVFGAPHPLGGDDRDARVVEPRACRRHHPTHRGAGVGRHGAAVAAA